jgi:putative serine protease PepD
MERTPVNRPARMPIVLSALAAALAIGAGAGAVIYSVVASPDSKTVVRQVAVSDSEPTANAESLTIGEIYRRAHKGVVEITVTSGASSDLQQQQRGQGSGFVYDSDGNIVTNEHVVEGAETVSVRFWNGDTYTARVVGTDPSTDLAVIKVVDVPESILTPIEVGDSSKVLVGDGVVAIGSPFGLEETVTSGIVSALHRQMQAPNNFTINDSIQTDAAINHGNSGGPLLNSRAQVIGVNAQIKSDGGGSDGVGFAIPSNTVRSIASQLIASGKVEHAYLGVQVDEIPGTVASELGLVEGVEVVEVLPNTPAAKAQLKEATGTKIVDGDLYNTGGDVITAIDGQEITTSEELQRAIDTHKPGDTIEVEVWRAGDTHTVEIELGTRPAS